MTFPPTFWAGGNNSVDVTNVVFTMQWFIETCFIMILLYSSTCGKSSNRVCIFVQPVNFIAHSTYIRPSVLNHGTNRCVLCALAVQGISRWICTVVEVATNVELFDYHD